MTTNTYTVEVDVESDGTLLRWTVKHVRDDELQSVRNFADENIPAGGTRTIKVTEETGDLRGPVTSELRWSCRAVRPAPDHRPADPSTMSISSET